MTTTIADFEQQILEKGKQEGKQEGMQKGMQKGMQEGMLKKAREFARRMLGDGEPEQKGPALYGSFIRRNPTDQE